MRDRLADRIHAALRQAPDGLSMSTLCHTVYQGRIPPRDPGNTLKQAILRMRREGSEIGCAKGVYTLTTSNPSVPSRCQNGGPPRLPPRSAEVIALLREYEDIGLTAQDLADEMRPTSNGRRVSTGQVFAILAREVPRIVPIERVGHSYRLANYRAGNGAVR